MAANIKRALTEAITNLSTEVRAMNTRLSSVESTVQCHDTTFVHVKKATRAYDKCLLEMHYYLEDLDNRGRRRNLRIRGITEDVDAAHLKHIVMGICNSLLSVPEGSSIAFESAPLFVTMWKRDGPAAGQHLLLGGLQTERKSCTSGKIQRPYLILGRGHLHLPGSIVQTLQRKRALKPLLQLLQDRNITYRWRFPFALSVSHAGIAVNLRDPDNVIDFCAKLHLPAVDLPDYLACLPSLAQDLEEMAGDSNAPAMSGFTGSPKQRRCRYASGSSSLARYEG